MMSSIVLLFAAACLGMTEALTCDSPPAVQVDFPIPTFHKTTFTMDLEIFDKQKNVLKGVKVRYDKYKKLIRWSTVLNSIGSDEYFVYDFGQILSFNYPKYSSGTCDVLRFPNPRTYKVGQPEDSTTMPSSLALLRFQGKDADGNTIIIQKKGQDTIHDRNVDKYVSCQTWALEDGTLIKLASVTHYFLASDWKYPGGSSVNIPVKILVQTSDGREYHYNFFNIKPFIDEFTLETPRGIFCPNRNISRPLPALPNFVKFTMEVLDTITPGHYFIDQIYDIDDRLAVLRGPETYSTFVGLNQDLYVSDYYTGLSYKIDTVTNMCDVANITSRDLPSGFADNGLATEYTPKKFFFADSDNFEYIGPRKIRGMVVDTWVGETTIPDIGDVIVEWYFALDNVVSWNSGIQDKSPLPLKCSIYLPFKGDASSPPTESQRREPIYEMNLFHVDFTLMLWEAFSIKPCLTSSTSNHFEMIFKGATGTIKSAFLENFKWTLTVAIKNIAMVPWFRVSDLRITFKGDDTVVEFEILDKPPYVGDSAYDVQSFVDLPEATENLKSRIQKGQFQVVVTRQDGSTQTIFANENINIHTGIPITTSKHPQPQKSTSSDYSSGAMAGLGIAMLVVGLGGGGGGAYYMLFKRGG